MKWKPALYLLLAWMASAGTLYAQSDTNLVQLSGLVLDGTTSQLAPVPYTSIYIEGSNRGTYSDFKGFFSIVIRKTETVTFSAIGYKTIEFKLPGDLKDDRYSIVQLMTQDTFNLPETVVFPWPSRENFRLEFLAMDVTPTWQMKPWPACKKPSNTTVTKMPTTTCAARPAATTTTAKALP